MTRINAYDTDAQIIEKVCEDNDITECELIEMLMEFLDDVKEDNGLV